MTSPVSGSSQSSAAENAQTQATNTKDKLSEKDTFLQLLVAQIKNQNPLNPADGTQFLSQLAQFSELEQMTQVRTEIEALRTDFNAALGKAQATDTDTGAETETEKTQEN
jgi:flagellar basal-body rod modification protein FlgD